MEITLKVEWPEGNDPRIGPMELTYGRKPASPREILSQIEIQREVVLAVRNKLSLEEVLETQLVRALRESVRVERELDERIAQEIGNPI